MVACDNKRLKDHIDSWTILYNLLIETLKLKGYILYYQQSNILFSENSL